MLRRLDVTRIDHVTMGTNSVSLQVFHWSSESKRRSTRWLEVIHLHSWADSYDPSRSPNTTADSPKAKKKSKKKSVRPYHRNGSQKVPRTRNNSDFQCYDNNESTCASCSLLHQVFMITWVYMVKQSTLSSGTTALYKHVVHCFLSAVLSKGHNRLSNCRRRRCCCCAETLLASRCWVHGVVVFGCRPGLVFRLGLLVYKVLSSV